jgi:hypothetical protein
MSVINELFYFGIDELQSRIRNESLYLEDGQKKDFDTNSINMDDLPFLKVQLKKACDEVFKVLHKLSYGIENAYQFDVAPENITELADLSLSGNQVIYYATFPENFDPNLVSSVDIAILEAIVYKTLYFWYRRKGKLTRKIQDDDINHTSQLRNLINYRIGVVKKYRLY